MFSNSVMLKIRGLINQERIYVLMLCFIILFNVMISLAEKIPELNDSFLLRRILRLRPEEAEEEEELGAPAYEQTAWREVLQEKKHLLMLLNMVGFLALCIFGLGLFLDIMAISGKLKRGQFLEASGKHFAVKWKIRDIFKIGIIFLFLGHIIYIFEGFLLVHPASRKEALRFLPLFNAGIMDLAIVGFIIYFVKIKYGQSIKAIGLKIKGLGKTISLGVLCYIAFLPILAFLLVFLVWLAAIFNYAPPQQAIFRLFLQEENAWFLFYSTMLVVILGPIAEEIFFRGFSYNVIKKRWGPQAAAILTAVVFAGLHANLLGFLPIMALGILLVYVYEKTGSLIPAITIHVVHNGLMVTLLFLGRYIRDFVK